MAKIPVEYGQGGGVQNPSTGWYINDLEDGYFEAWYKASPSVTGVATTLLGAAGAMSGYKYEKDVSYPASISGKVISTVAMVYFNSGNSGILTSNYLYTDRFKLIYFGAVSGSQTIVITAHVFGKY